MTMDEILEAVIALCENDQSIDDSNIITWTNMAINRINTACKANIPLVTDIGAITPSFDARYHEALVLFCVVKYREADTAYSDSTYFMNQFNAMLQNMQRDMEIAPSLKKDIDYQQIVINDITIFTYPLTIPYGSYFDKLEVFQNDNLLDSKTYTFDIGNKNITFTGITFTQYDKITLHFQNDSTLNQPPYQWWGTSGW